jgi:hypothetical protein
MPPFESEAQRRAFHYLESKGKISKDTVDEWEAATPDKKNLPEHVCKECGRPYEQNKT